MPYAQWHYPFENKKLVEKTFPADFIAEGIDQTRGWFYTLHVLATALTLRDIGLGRKQPAFKNVIVNGLILGEDGKKLSKRLRNYPDVNLVLNKYGADSLRYFLLSSTPIGEDYILSEKRIGETFRKTLMTFWNSLIFWETYGGKEVKIPNKIKKTNNILDQWILSRLYQTVKEIRKQMEVYDLTKASRPIAEFIDDLSNWYIRRSRRQFQKPKNKKQKKNALVILGYVLSELAKMSAPFMPFISEEIYQRLPLRSKEDSVHLERYPDVEREFINPNLEEDMKKTREIAQRVLAERAKAKIKIRQPLSLLKIRDPKFKTKNQKKLLDLIKEEVNVKEIVIDKRFYLNKKITPALWEEGVIREIIRQIQSLRKEGRLTPRDRIKVGVIGDSPITEMISKWRKEIEKEVFAKEIEIGQRYPLKKEIKIEKRKFELSIAKEK